jgi:hypothetical protein
MGKVKIPYYAVIKGNGYWSPSAKMKTAGLLSCAETDASANDAISGCRLFGIQRFQ